MTTIIFIGGLCMITYAIIAAFCPAVDKEEQILVETNEHPVMITKIVDVTPADNQHKIVVDDVQGEIITDIFTYYDVPLSDEIQQYIHIQCLEKFGTIELDGYDLPKLVINIIRWESGFDAANDNGKCCGLMSVTHKLSDTIIEEEHITNLIEPDQNIRAGIRILKNMYDYAYTLSNEHAWPTGGLGNIIRVNMMLDCYHNGRDNYELDGKYIRNILSTYKATKERS